MLVNKFGVNVATYWSKELINNELENYYPTSAFYSVFPFSWNKQMLQRRTNNSLTTIPFKLTLFVKIYWFSCFKQQLVQYCWLLSQQWRFLPIPSFTSDDVKKYIDEVPIRASEFECWNWHTEMSQKINLSSF